MNYQNSKLLTKEQKKNLRKLERIIKEGAITAEKMFLQYGDTTVIPYGVALHWIDHLGALIIYSISKRELANNKLCDRDRSIFEEQLKNCEHIETLIPEITKESFQNENFTRLMLRRGCTDATALMPKNELCVRASMFLPDIDFIREIEKRRQISLEYHDLSALDSRLDLLNEVDKAVRLVDKNTILPLKIYCQFLELVKLLAFFRVLDEVVGVAQTKQKNLDDCHLLSKELNEKLKLWIERYPFLAGKPRHDIDRLLLDFYTRPPSEIIEMFGPDEICFPYVVPDAMKNSPFNALNN